MPVSVSDLHNSLMLLRGTRELGGRSESEIAEQKTSVSQDDRARGAIFSNQTYASSSALTRKFLELGGEELECGAGDIEQWKETMSTKASFGVELEVSEEITLASDDERLRIKQDLPARWK